jgi:hypothetical protein
MQETARHPSPPWKWLPWTIGAFIVVVLAIFFTDGVPELIRPWFEPHG